MPKHHSEDYKSAAVQHYIDKGSTMREVCETFQCSFQSLKRWIDKYQCEGNVARKKRDTRKLKVTPEIVSYVKMQIKRNNTITLWELSKLVEEYFHVTLTDSAIHNILTEQNITRKRLRKRYYPERQGRTEEGDISSFYQTLLQYDYKRTICLDETSIYLNMTQAYGRSKSGTRVLKKTNLYPFKRFNMLCAIHHQRVVGWKLYENVSGGLTRQHVIDFYNEFIADIYNDHLIIMDNAVIHRSREMKDRIQATGNYLLYTVPYHPETNAIEEFFSQLKHYIKKESPNTYQTISALITKIIREKITRRHLTNYLKHSFRIYD